MSAATRTLRRTSRRDAVRREKARRTLKGRAAKRTPAPSSSLNPMRLDPSRTGMLRVKAGAAVRLRYARLRTALYRAVVLEDALGLRGRPDWLHNAEPTANAFPWSVLPTADRLRAFGAWLTGTAEDLWRGLEETLYGIAELAIRRGAGRSFDEARAGHFLDPNFRAGGRDQFLDGVLRDPDNRERFDALKKRIGDESVNHRDSVVEKVERSISDAVIQEQSPTEAWKEITTIIDREQDSATTTVYDEVVRDHSEGQVAGFEEAGVTDLFPLMEWTVNPEASKSGTCPRCWAMAGTVWTIEDARGKIPLHRNCKCSWTARPLAGLKPKTETVPPIERYAPGAGFKGNAFNPDQPRDDHGRWTNSDGRGDSEHLTVPIGSVSHREWWTHELAKPAEVKYVESIRKHIESGGTLPAVTVRPLPDGGFEVVDGNHRLEAARRAGLTHVRVRVYDPDGVLAGTKPTKKPKKK